ncbi:MAG: IS1595 family transposase [Alphaproteobacteria bacterium]|nr:IS1595 family transposase [Alphaproteobacteria bacterium]
MEKSPSSSPDFSVRDFFKRFPDDDACLAHIMEQRYGLKGICPHCGVETTFHKISGRKSYAGADCGCHIYPCAGTIFQDSRTPLQSWYYAIYLFIATRHGVSAKELQRTLGVTYKTAWRIGHQIRDLLAKANGFEALRGHVEIDETFVGGMQSDNIGRSRKQKTVVLGMKQRKGRLVVEVVDDYKRSTLKPVILETVEEGATVSTDLLRSYLLLEHFGYDHGRVNHDKQWVNGIHHTNNLESFWNLFKNSVRGTHVHISKKHMQRYLNEFSFRSNHRERVNLMFDLVVGAL